MEDRSWRSMVRSTVWMSTRLRFRWRLPDRDVEPRYPGCDGERPEFVALADQENGTGRRGVQFFAKRIRADTGCLGRSRRQGTTAWPWRRAGSHALPGRTGMSFCKCPVWICGGVLYARPERIRRSGLFLARGAYLNSAAFSGVTRTAPVSISSGISSPAASLRAYSTPICPML